MVPPTQLASPSAIQSAGFWLQYALEPDDGALVAVPDLVGHLGACIDVRHVVPDRGDRDQALRRDAADAALGVEHAGLHARRPLLRRPVVGVDREVEANVRSEMRLDLAGHLVGELGVCGVAAALGRRQAGGWRRRVRDGEGDGSRRPRGPGEPREVRDGGHGGRPLLRAQLVPVAHEPAKRDRTRRDRARIARRRGDVGQPAERERERLECRVLRHVAVVADRVVDRVPGRSGHHRRLALGRGGGRRSRDARP